MWAPSRTVSMSTHSQPALKLLGDVARALPAREHMQASLGDTAVQLGLRGGLGGRPLRGVLLAAAGLRELRHAVLGSGPAALAAFSPARTLTASAFVARELMMLFFRVGLEAKRTLVRLGAPGSGGTAPLGVVRAQLPPCAVFDVPPSNHGGQGGTSPPALACPSCARCLRPPTPGSCGAAAYSARAVAGRSHPR